MDNRTNSYPEIPDVPLLAEVLKEAGFQTSAFYGNRLLGQGLGYDRGFDRFSKSSDRNLPSNLKKLLRTVDLDERQFLYLHMFGGHQPLRPTKESIEKWDLERRLVKKPGFRLQSAAKGDEGTQQQYGQAYRAVVEDIDTRLGHVLDALAPIRDDALIIVTSDHGEMLGEHGHFGHNHWLYEPLTQVPFVAVGADSLPETISTSAIPDLITRTLGIEHDWQVKYDQPGPLVSQREGNLAFSPDGRLKGIWDPGEFSSGFAAFDLVDDPGETQSLEDAQGNLEAARGIWEDETPREQLMPLDGSMDDDMIEALEELGYME